MPRYTRVCIPCRNVKPTGDACQFCGGALRWAPKYWRAPRKTNLTAWKRIAAGEWLWDRVAVERAGRRSSQWRPSVRLMSRMLKEGEIRENESYKYRLLGPKRRG